MAPLDTFVAAAKELWDGDVSAQFSAYSELKHTWRATWNGIAFRLSDYLDDAPDEVMQSLAWYLVSRAVRTNCPEDRSRAYLAYSRSRDLWARKRDRYLSRARSLVLTTQGRARDLRVAYDYVNFFYFSGKLRGPTLAWTRESPKQRVGFYFEPLNLLAVNSALDSEEVPRYVLEFVLYHELLHHIDADSLKKRRRVHHTKQFREQERRFTHFVDAEGWLERICRSKAR